MLATPLDAENLDAEKRYASYRQEVRKYLKQALSYNDSESPKLEDIKQKFLMQSRLWSQLPETH